MRRLKVNFYNKLLRVAQIHLAQIELAIRTSINVLQKFE